MTASRKVPEHIARELRRHVKPKPGQSNSSSSGNGSKVSTLIGCAAFIGVTASMPLLAMKWIQPLSDRDEALTQAQTRRGAFNNSGTRDVGRDPNWDFKTGTRIKNKEYTDLFVKDNPNEMDHGDKYVYESKRR
eukprot:CAMPEP_0197239640 /NCGR_PEP_ID=MMETSP1429-20130617/6089_1 /TAXON_ID=49237 /ORGANISM="Chaetoceros  sp., Strain UNC1202" /LENGTH=133 /DNA_ID=CAMNT_0042699095 /DNA_START=73 /DNA_END=471 /DNA_ORIENTATION=+